VTQTDQDEMYYDEDAEELRMNFTGVPDIEPIKLIPSGLQHCKIADAKIEKAGPNAKYPGGPVISLDFRVESGEYEGRHVWDRIAVSKEALFDDKGEYSFGYKKLKALVGALGYDTSNDANIRFRVVDWIDQHVDVDVGRKAGSFDPETGNEYKAKNTATGFYPHEMTEADQLR
jgi:hypothetical protein